MVKLTNIINIFLLNLLLLPLIGHASSISDATVPDIIPLLEKRITTVMKEQNIPGVAVAIVSRDKVYYLKTFGVKRIGKAEAINPTTLFQIASLSKPINATMLAILQEKGKLSLNDPVHRFVPHFEIRNNHKTVKICHLMSHSSGIPKGGVQ